METSTIRFHYRGEVHEVSDQPTTRTVLRLSLEHDVRRIVDTQAVVDLPGVASVTIASPSNSLSPRAASRTPAPARADRAARR